MDRQATVQNRLSLLITAKDEGRVAFIQFKHAAQGVNAFPHIDRGRLQLLSSPLSQNIPGSLKGLERALQRARRLIAATVGNVKFNGVERSDEKADNETSRRRSI